jgi:hypothetical protein
MDATQARSAHSISRDNKDMVQRREAAMQPATFLELGGGGGALRCSVVGAVASLVRVPSTIAHATQPRNGADDVAGLELCLTEPALCARSHHQATNIAHLGC